MRFTDKLYSKILTKLNTIVLVDRKRPSYWIDKYLKGKNLQAVQIGSNDGVLNDPIHLILMKNRAWKALFVEPVPYLFEKLKRNYRKRRNCSFENAAINNGEEMVFYYVDASLALSNDPSFPPWIKRIGSFYKEHISKHLEGRLNPYILELNLQGLTLSGLFDKHKIAKVDLLHIDAEGYDWLILKQLDLELINPSVILIEKAHLSKDDYLEVLSKFQDDYQIFDFGRDLLFLNKSIISEKLIPDYLIQKRV